MGESALNNKLWVATAVFIVALAFRHFFYNLRRAEIPPHLLNHNALWLVAVQLQKLFYISR